MYAMGVQRLGPQALWRFLGERKNTPFRPFEAQLDLFDAITIPYPGHREDGVPRPSIFPVNCGRRFSKTTILEKLLWEGMTVPEDMFGPPCVRITADTEEHAHKVWDRFLWHLENTPLVALKEHHSKERNLVLFKGGAEAQMLSADNPAALAGDGVTLWLIDEAQELSLAAWENLFPSTAERDGVIVLAGVAEGDGPFREVSYRGEHPETYPDYKTLRYSTYENPLVPRTRIELARRTLPPERFAQLYLAEWQDTLYQIFRGVLAGIRPLPIYGHDQGWGYTSPPLPGMMYYGGLDLARLADWTVFTIFDHTGQLVAWDRFTLLDWNLQRARILALSAAYGHPRVAVDSTGIGDPLCQELQSKGMSVHPIQITTNQVKRSLVDGLAIDIGNGQRTYPRIPTMIEELQRFQATKSRNPNSSVITYQAPSGATDDWVMSLALANSLMPHDVDPRGVGSDREQDELREVGAWETIR